MGCGNAVQARRIHVRFASATIGVCMAAAMAVASAAQPAVKCSKGPWDFKDPETMNLPDGEHSLGKVDIPEGTLEVRVVVKNKTISDPMYYLKGKKLRKTADSRVPKELRECLGLKKTASVTEWIAPPLTATLDWLITPAEAKSCRVRILSAACNESACCALAACGSARAVWCV